MEYVGRLEQEVRDLRKTLAVLRDVSALTLTMNETLGMPSGAGAGHVR